MTLRTRLSIILAVGFAVAGVAFALLTQMVVEQSLYGAIDQRLNDEVQRVLRDREFRGGPGPGPGPRPGRGSHPDHGAGELFGPRALIARVTTNDGEVLLQTSGVDALGGLPDPVIGADDPNRLSTVRLRSERFRLIEANAGRGLVVQVAMSMAEVPAFLDVLNRVLLVAAALALAAAVVLGQWAARATLAPVKLMTRAAQDIARDPSKLAARRVAPAFPDPELRGFAESVNEMLDSIDAAQSQQRTFVAEASHELRSPLTSLGGNAAYLERYGSTFDVASQDALGAVRRDVERLTRIADGLTTLARLDAIPEVQLEPVDIDRVAAETVERSRTMHPDHVFSIEGSAGTLLLDVELLRRIIGNLVDNAGRYTPAGTTVSTRLDSDGTSCTITVCDDGPGIPPAELDQVRGRFRRGSTAAGTAGSGLGLAIVDEAARALGGALTVAAAEPHGLCCTVRLVAGSAPSPAG